MKSPLPIIALFLGIWIGLYSSHAVEKWLDDGDLVVVKKLTVPRADSTVRIDTAGTVRLRKPRRAPPEIKGVEPISVDTTGALHIAPSYWPIVIDHDTTGLHQYLIEDSVHMRNYARKLIMEEI